MMNGALVQQAISASPGTLLYDVLSGPETDVEKISRLSRATLAREPTDRELATFRALLRQALRNRADRGVSMQVVVAERLQDAYWAYLNSAEFLVNH
jgi:hypothetical protein